MKNIILLSFKRMTQKDANSFASSITQRMTDDTQFADLKPMVEVVKVLNEAFTVAFANAVHGGTDRTRVKNDCFDALITKLDELAQEVERKAKGDENIALSAGFDIRKPAKPIQDLSTPAGLSVENAPRTGAIKLRWESNPAVVNYAIEHQVKGEETWKNGTYSTSSDAVLSGFSSGSYAMVRICGLGRKGLKTEWTEPVGVWVI